MLNAQYAKKLQSQLIMFIAKLSKLFSTLNKSQMKQFDQISEWWHPSGPMHILYKYNYERVQFLKSYLGQNASIDNLKPFKGLKILDVGCGAGFLTKSLARLGAQVVGLDPNSSSYREATEHKSKHADELNSLNYFNSTLEQYLGTSELSIKQFDIVTSLDVIQHVDNPKIFLENIKQATKEGGLVMISTIARNPITWFTHIALAEYITRIVPLNTHSYDKFINPNELQEIFLGLGIQVVAKKELDLDWRGEFHQKQGGGNYIFIGRKSGTNDK